MCYLCMKSFSDFELSNMSDDSFEVLTQAQGHTVQNKKISWPLRVLEDHHKDKDWQGIIAKGKGNVDMNTGYVELDLDLWLDEVIKADQKRWSEWDGMPESSKDDDKTQIVNPYGVPIQKITCSWPIYKDYLGLNESFRYCEKCGKKESEHS